MVSREDRWKRKNLTTAWTWPFEVSRIYENGSVLLKDLRGLEFPGRINIGKLKKYLVNDQIQGILEHDKDKLE